MDEPRIPTPEERGQARDLAEHFLARIGNPEPLSPVFIGQVWLLAATLKFYVPILEVAWKIAKHWHEQEGVNAALLDELVAECFREQAVQEQEGCRG